MAERVQVLCEVHGLEVGGGDIIYGPQNRGHVGLSEYSVNKIYNTGRLTMKHCHRHNGPRHESASTQLSALTAITSCQQLVKRKAL